MRCCTILCSHLNHCLWLYRILHCCLSYDNPFLGLCSLALFTTHIDGVPFVPLVICALLLLLCAIMLQLICRIFHSSIFNMTDSASLSPGKKMHLLLFSFTTPHLPNCRIIVLLYVLCMAVSFVDASQSSVVLENFFEYI